MSDANEFSDLVEAILEHGPPYDETERLVLAVFGPRNPDWEGVSIPKVDAFRRYLKAVEISKKLFGNSDKIEINYQPPEPFKDYCGMYFHIKSEDARAVAAVFQDEGSVKSVRDLVDLVDTVSIDAELLLGTGEPRLCFSWYINDPYVGNPDRD